MQEGWSIAKIAEWCTNYLAKNGVEDARVNAEYIISHILGKTRLEIYLDPKRTLTKGEYERLRSAIARRAKREPLQYILGTQPFRNIDVKVRQGVYIPRPETEILVDEAIKLIPPHSKYTILELGIGSGAISTAIASEREHVLITATDISELAIQVAMENARPFRERISILKGDLFEPVSGRIFDMIISNPPYIKEGDWETLQPEIKDYEPREAFVGGADGLDFYRRIFNNVGEFLVKGGHLLLEVGDDAAAQVNLLATASDIFENVIFKKDLNNIPRVFIGRRR